MHVDDPLEIMADPTPTVEALIERAEAHVQLLGSGEDTARALQMTPNHVAVALRRAKAALRACLERAQEAMAQ